MAAISNPPDSIAPQKDGDGGPGRAATAGGGPMQAIGMHHGPAHRPFRRSLPLLLLLLALSTAFQFGNDRGQFYRSPHHDAVSANHLAVAANLSPEHDFLLFYYQTLDKDGTPYLRSIQSFSAWRLCADQTGHVAVRITHRPSNPI